MFEYSNQLLTDILSISRKLFNKHDQEGDDEWVDKTQDELIKLFADEARREMNNHKNLRDAPEEYTIDLSYNIACALITIYTDGYYRKFTLVD